MELMLCQTMTRSAETTARWSH